MNKSKQIKTVYHELRSALGDKFSRQELLLHADSLVSLFSDELSGPRFELYQGGTPFENRTLDSVISDGEWRVFWYEFHSGSDLDRESWDDVPPDLLEGIIDMEELTCQM